MKRRDLKLIDEGFKKLISDYDFAESWDGDTAEGLILVTFPRDEELYFEVDDLLEYFSELESLKIHDYNRVTTDSITQRVITISDINKYLEFHSLETIVEENIRLKILSQPFLIGLAAIKNSEYGKYYPPCSSHMAVEIKYLSKDRRLSIEDEEKLLKSFFFELSHSFKVSFEFDSFKYDESEFREEDNSIDLPKVFEEYNVGMDMFIKANQSLTSDLKFLAYYKVFEYFAPLYSKIDAFEAMRKKLDSSNANNLSGDFIASVFDLTRNYQNSIRDKELVKSLIDNTFDLVDIYDDLPIGFKKYLKINKLEYSSQKEVKEKVINHLGNVLYNTRNSIVHAKSNYNFTGIECPDDELMQLNKFMHKATYSTIKWYNRLPMHLKIG